VEGLQMKTLCLMKGWTLTPCQDMLYLYLWFTQGHHSLLTRMMLPLMMVGVTRLWVQCRSLLNPWKWNSNLNLNNNLKWIWTMRIKDHLYQMQLALYSYPLPVLKVLLHRVMQTMKLFHLFP
jgi:hypothetical protein